MEKAVAMDIVQGRGYLLNDVTNLLVAEGVIIEFSHLHHSVQVHVQQLEKHVKGVFVTDHFQAGDNILVL